MNEKNEEIRIDLEFLKCHIFRNAQNKWKISKDECLDIFLKNNLFNFIDENYQFMHMQGINTSVCDIERMLKYGKS